VAGDWGRYGRIRLWGSAGFLLTVFVAGWWFQEFGMRHFPAWAGFSLLLVLIATLRLPDVREPATHSQATHTPVMSVLRKPVVRWFFASLFFNVMAHFAIYAFLSLYMDSLGYSKSMIGGLWAVSVVMEIGWFFLQGRFIGRLPMTRWLVVCGALTALRMAITGALGDFGFAIFIGQVLHAMTFGAHHACCIALVSHYFPDRLRARGQALFTVIGYGFGGVLGVLAGGALASAFGFRAMFLVAAVLGVLATLCAWQVYRAEHPRPQ
jgi:PPP family 3-phenylpropionic acid transporter